MPADAATVARQQAAMKEVYSKMGEKHFDEKTFTLDILDKGDFNSPSIARMMADEDKDGKMIVLQAHTAGNPNAGIPVSESAGYPRAGSQERNTLRFRSKALVSSASITAETLARTSNDYQSVFRVAAKEGEDLISNTRRKENKWALGDGSALLGTTTGTDWDDSANTITVAAAETSNFEVGMEIVPRTKQGGALMTGWPETGGVPHPAKITAIDSATGALTVVDGYTGSAMSFSDVTTEHGVYPWDAQGEAPWGLDIVCSDANPSAHGFDPASAPEDEVGLSKNFGGVDRTANAWWKGIPQKDLGGRTIDVQTDLIPLEGTLLQRDSTAREQYSIFCLSAYQEFNDVVHQLEVAKRTVHRTRITDNQWEVVQSGMFTFGYDTEVAAGDYFFFNPKHLYRLVLVPWHFEDFQGSEYTQINDALGRPTSGRRRNLRKEGNMLASSCRHAHKFINAGVTS